MPAAWPGTLPQAFILDSLSESPATGAIRTQMDAGPDHVRARYSAVPVGFTGKMIMTTAQIAILDTFYKTTLVQGTDTITALPHARTGSAVTHRFVAPPRWAPLDGANWEVQLALEILP